MTAAPLDRDGLREQVIDEILKDDNGHIDTATIDAIMQLAEEYARSVCVVVLHKLHEDDIMEAWKRGDLSEVLKDITK